MNTAIAISRPVEEFALPLRSKKKRLTRQDLVGYFGSERLGLTERVIDKIMCDFAKVRIAWETLIGASFVSDQMKKKYLQVLAERYARIEVG